MAAQTQMYYFNQRQQVVFLESGQTIATRRYLKVYSKDLSASKGVDNLIEFAFVNQNQKPVNLTGKEITARIISYDGSSILLQKTLTPIYIITGLMSLILTTEDLENINVQRAFYTLEVSDGSTSYPTFTDTQSDYRGTIDIVDGLMPRFIPSTSVSIPSHLPPQAADILYTSSIVGTRDTGIFTLQIQYSNFTGTTKIEGSILSDFSIPYAITSAEQFINCTESRGITVVGWHPYIRLSIANQGTAGVAPPEITGQTYDSSYRGGDVTSIFYR